MNKTKGVLVAGIGMMIGMILWMGRPTPDSSQPTPVASKPTPVSPETANTPEYRSTPVTAPAVADKTTPPGNSIKETHLAAEPAADPVKAIESVLVEIGAPLPDKNKPPQYQYDGQGRILRMTQEGQVTTFTYDESGQIIEVDDPSGYRSKFGYDMKGNRQRKPDSYR